MRSIHGAPLKDKLTQRVILASSQVAHLVLPNTQANPSQNQKRKISPAALGGSFN